MLMLIFIQPHWHSIVGIATIAFAVGVYIYGENSDRISWPWALAVFILGVPIVLIFAMVECISYFREDIWADPKEKRKDEYDIRGLPSKWKKKYREDASTRRYIDPPDRR